MDASVFVAIITAAGGVVVAALTFYLTKRHQLWVEWQQAKLNHYKVLLSSLSDLAISGTDKCEANRKFATAVNTIALVAPQYVIRALMAFHEEITFSNPRKSEEQAGRRLRELLLTIRKDIGLARKDDPLTFEFRLIGQAPDGER